MGSRDKVEIQITFLDRKFPIEIDPEDEPLIEEAVQLIRKKMETFQKAYQIKDEIYLTLMVCLDIAHDYVLLKHERKNQVLEDENSLEELTHLIEDALKEEADGE